MDQTEIKKLLERYENGECTAEEKAKLDSWYLATEAAQPDDLPEPDYKKIEAKLNLALGIPKERPVTPYYKYIAAAASLFVVVGLGVYFYSDHIQQTGSRTEIVNDIAPGKVGATLTLADGKVITLGDAANGELAKESGVTITKSADGKLVYSIAGPANAAAGRLNTLSTANGQTYDVVLPDGTKITLNAASSIRYAANLALLKERKVELTGEAYFAVKHDASKPFRVETKGQLVEDIGTEFNINSYADEPVIKTTLVEGSARVISLIGGTSGPGASVILKPDQQSLLSGSGSLKAGPADVEEVTAWKNGEIILNGQDVKSIMRMVSRWYNVEVDYEGEVSKELYYAKISRFENISELLKLLEKAQGVHFKVEGRRVTVTK